MSCSHGTVDSPDNRERDGLPVPSLCRTSFHATSPTVDSPRLGSACLRPSQAPSRPCLRRYRQEG